MLCQPSLESDRIMAQQGVVTPPPHLPHDYPPVGFQFLVSPINETQGKKHSQFGNKPHLGYVQKMHRGPHAPHQVAITLSDYIRQELQRREISPQESSNYLAQLPSLIRYDNAFQSFFSIFALPKVGTLET